MTPLIVLSILGISVLAAVWALVFLLSEKHAVTLWDVLLLFAPPALWFLLMVSGLRPVSLSILLVEPFVLVPILATCFVTRVFAFPATSHTKRSTVALVIGLLATTIFYAFVPPLAA